MPIYEYACQSCGKRTELLQRMADPPLAACPACGGEVKKLISAPAVQFKGSGWYVTDYAGKNASKTSESKGDSKGESKSETKSEAKSDSAPASKPAASE
jgi:putative FmdB family regulatory protein